MKIPADAAVIPQSKLTDYLLTFREKNDKSKWLARGGFTLDNWQALDAALRRLIRDHDAVHDRSNEYGDYFRVEGELIGANERTLAVVTIWIVRVESDDQFHFVTMKPGS